MRARAFTLVELLVVIGIVALLIGILIPMLAGARRSARDVTCAARLRDLTAATTMHLNLHRAYPRPRSVPAFGGPVPLALSQEVLNQLGEVLRWKTVDYGMGVGDLPQLVSCPLRHETDLLLEPYPAAAFGEPFWNTGYAYCAGLMDVGSTVARASVPGRVAPLRGKKRGVVWADSLLLLTVGANPSGYAYWHWKGAHQIDLTFLTVVAPTSLRGHHRAWSDGSVEWLPVGTFNLDPAAADRSAGYFVGQPGALGLYFYF